jgi:hypothetical protein
MGVNVVIYLPGRRGLKQNFNKRRSQAELGNEERLIHGVIIDKRSHG